MLVSFTPLPFWDRRAALGRSTTIGPRQLNIVRDCKKWFAGRFACARTPQKCRNIYKYDKGIADISIFLWKKDYFCRIQTPKWLIGANDR